MHRDIVNHSSDSPAVLGTGFRLRHHGQTKACIYQDDQRGVNGRKINFIQYDDAYSPPKAVEQVRKLVESDEVLFTFQIIGTASNAAVQKFSMHTGGSKFTDPKNFPWTIAFSYFVEGRIYGQYIVKTYPDAKIGILYQNDDLGKDYLNGIKSRLGDKAAKMVVTQESYEVSDPTADSQILKIKDAGADLFFSASTAKQAASRSGSGRFARIGDRPTSSITTDGRIAVVSASAVLVCSLTDKEWHETLPVRLGGDAEKPRDSVQPTLGYVTPLTRPVRSAGKEDCRRQRPFRSARGLSIDAGKLA
jgi:Periplasmic binding protein